MNRQLAQEVKRRVLAEPKLVDMNYFCAKVRVSDIFCNTVGCIAGHAIKASGISFMAIQALGLYNMEDIGRSLLDISKAEARQLFYFYSSDASVESGVKSEEDYPYVRFARRLRKQRAGSKRYAKIVADAIDYAIYRDQNNLQLEDPQ